MTEITNIYGTGVNDITAEILATVEKREQLKKMFNRCLDTEVCPKCGKNLTITHPGEDEDTFYRCTGCHFQYSRY